METSENESDFGNDYWGAEWVCPNCGAENDTGRISGAHQVGKVYTLTCVSCGETFGYQTVLTPAPPESVT